MDIAPEIKMLMELKKIGEWFVNGDTGASSKFLACIFLGGTPDRISYPHDPSDFRRCYEFLELFPESEWDGILNDAGKLSGEWQRIKENWTELVNLYRKEKGLKHAPLLYKKMKELYL